MKHREAGEPPKERNVPWFPVTGIPGLKEGAPEELVIQVFGVDHKLGRRLASAWSDIKPAVESDAARIAELSKLIPNSPPLSEESVLSIVRNDRKEVGYPQHILVYKPDGVVKGFSWAELNERSKVAHVRATVCPVLGVGFLLDLSMNHLLESQGCNKCFTDPNDWARKNVKRLGYTPLTVPFFSGRDKTFYGRNVKPREIYYEVANVSFMEKVRVQDAAAIQVMRRWPMKDRAGGIAGLLDVCNDIVEYATRYRMEGHAFRNEVYEELRQRNPIPLVKYLILKSALFNEQEFERTRDDVTINASRLPVEVRRGTKVLKFGPPGSIR